MRSRGLCSLAAAGLLAGLMVGAFGDAIPAFAASPSSSSIGPSKSSASWSGKYFALGSTPGPGACPPSIDQDVLCDHFNLSVGVDHAYWSSHTGGATISIGWGSSADNFDLYVYSGGSEVGHSAKSSGTSESVYLSKPSGTYEVRVVPVVVVDSAYSGSAKFSSTPVPTPPPSPSPSPSPSPHPSPSPSPSGGGGGGGGGGSGSGSGTGGIPGSGTGGGSFWTGGGGGPGFAGGTYSGGTVTERFYYVYGVDRTSWFWREQIDQPVPVPGVPVNVTVRLPSPQQPDTLPVSTNAGAPDKQSALFLDLSARGMPAGSTIKHLSVTIQEGQFALEMPNFDAGAGRIRACRISQPWTSGEAEPWSSQPARDAACVEGTRNATGTTTYWTFDLTTLAAGWGAHPSRDRGVVFVPLVPNGAGPGDTWQVNLKIPSLDNPVTPGDEYTATQKAVVVDVSFAPPATGGGGGGGGPGGPPAPGPGGTGAGNPPGAPGGPGIGGGGTVPGNGYGAGGGSLLGSGSGAFSGGGGLLGAGAPGSSTGGSLSGGAPVSAGARGGLGSLPWYVWLLLPAAVIAGALLRSAIFEPGAVKAAAAGPAARGPAAAEPRAGTAAKASANGGARVPAAAGNGAGTGARSGSAKAPAPEMAKATSASGPPIP